MSYILKTNQLTKSFEGREVVSGVNMHVKKGEIYGFLGPNGAGKNCKFRRKITGSLYIKETVIYFTVIKLFFYEGYFYD